MERDRKTSRLKTYIFLRSEVDEQLEKLIKMKNNELFPTRLESDGSKHTASGNDRMANAIVRRLGCQDKILDEVEQKIDEMEIITDAINDLSDPLERELLRMRYTDCETLKHTPWKEIALDLYGDNDEAQMQMVFRIHKRAISNLIFND